MREQKIGQVAVIGAGVMGSGIAAHIANAGVPVLLLDVVPVGAETRNVLAETALQHQLKSGGFMHAGCAEQVTVGNLEDDIGQIADADWIIEVVIERLDVKRELYARIDALRKPGALVSSNTSTIPLTQLVEGRSDDFTEHFLVTHFFNPPRHMRLLEVVRGKRTRTEAVETLVRFCDITLGKGVVHCNDTPGFIANRIGIFWLQAALQEAIAGEISVEEADALLGRPAGVPKTGVFGLWDLVGIDLGPHLVASLVDNLSEDDAFQPYARTPELVRQLIEAGQTGRKRGAGFYRLDRSNGRKEKQALDLATGDYRPLQAPELDSLAAARDGLRALLQHDDRGGRYAWRVLSGTLAYAASLVPEICDDIAGVDAAMRLGYNWRHGPFELLDRIGPSWFAERLRAEGRAVPALLEQLGDDRFYRYTDGRQQQFGADGGYRPVPRAEGVRALADIKRAAEPLANNDAASLWDLGDGVACLEYHTRMNAVDADMLAMIEHAVDIVAEKFRALVIYNDGAAFSAGANLGLVSDCIKRGDWRAADELVDAGQRAYRKLKYAPFPVVGAVAGLALGGGCEVLLHCDAIQAHAESYLGLVEVNVGVVPAWGGCTELLLRMQAADVADSARRTFELISSARISTSAVEARELGLLRAEDGISMNRDRLLADAVDRTLILADGYRPPAEQRLSASGAEVAAALVGSVEASVTLGEAGSHQIEICRQLADVLCGDVAGESRSEAQLLACEHAAFISLIQQPDSQARMAHMLSTGKSLRN